MKTVTLVFMPLVGVLFLSLFVLSWAFAVFGWVIFPLTFVFLAGFGALAGGTLGLIAYLIYVGCIVAWIERKL